MFGSWDGDYVNYHRKPSQPLGWDGYTRTIAPTLALMSVADAATHCHISHTDDDAYLASLIDTATAWIEGPSGIGLALRPQTWQLRLNELPRRFTIGLSPVQSITAITVDGEAIDPSLYRLNGDEVIGSYPVHRHSDMDVVITFVAGYAAIPADIIHAAKLIVGHLYMFREAAIAGGRTEEVLPIPFGVEAILNRYRRY